MRTDQGPLFPRGHYVHPLVHVPSGRTTVPRLLPADSVPVELLQEWLDQSRSRISHYRSDRSIILVTFWEFSSRARSMWRQMRQAMPPLRIQSSDIRDKIMKVAFVRSPIIHISPIPGSDRGLPPLPYAQLHQLLSRDQFQNVPFGISLSLQQFHRVIIATDAQQPVAQGLVLVAA